MNSNFEKMYKILSGMNGEQLSYIINLKNINEVPIYNEDGSFNEKLLTKEGFTQSIFADIFKDINAALDKEREAGEDEQIIEKDKARYNSIFGSLYDAIANLDGDGKMSEDEIKFIASFSKNSDKQDVIDIKDFYDLGVMGRSPNMHIKDNSSIHVPSKSIVSPNRIEALPAVAAVNDELQINGKIDEPVIQGNVGDCWLLAGLNALNASDKGREIIRNSIIPNDDGTVTVKFAGVGKEITLSPEEIKKYDTDTNFQDNYSNGDNDALVIEMAMQKLIEENPSLLEGQDVGINGGYTFNIWKALVPNYNIEFIRDSESDNIHIADKIREVFTKAVSNKNIAIAFADSQHAMAVTEVSENKVTFINSQNYTKYTMSWDEFIESGIAGAEICYTDLSDTV